MSRKKKLENALRGLLEAIGSQTIMGHGLAELSPMLAEEIRNAVMLIGEED